MGVYGLVIALTKLYIFKVFFYIKYLLLSLYIVGVWWVIIEKLCM
jgi:hypothetical protein